MKGYLAFTIFFILILFYGLNIGNGQEQKSNLLINYQGTLINNNIELKNGPIDLRFSLYTLSEPGSGIKLWEEVQIVTINNKSYNVLLGGVNPIDESILKNPSLYLQLEVDYGNTNGVMDEPVLILPRQRILKGIEKGGAPIRVTPPELPEQE